MAGTKRTKTALDAEIISNLNDNVVGDITPQELRDIVADVIASVDYSAGWGFYVDGETAPATQTFTSTRSKLQIDGAGTGNTDYLPIEIRGTADLWDTTNDKITPVREGDSYSVRIDFVVTGETGNPNDIVLELDIGGAIGVIVNTYVTAGKTTPYVISVGFPIFCLSTFTANGADIYVSTDTGTITVGRRQISIHRLSTNY